MKAAWLGMAIFDVLVVATFGALTTLAIADMWRGLRAHWRKAGQVIRPAAGDPDPVAVAAGEILAITCPWCTGGRGECACPQRCERPACRGDWTTTVTVWTPEEQAMLRGERELPR